MSASCGRGRLLVVSGPSGVGKGRVVAEMLRRRPDLWLSVSTTTRAPRVGEVPGRDYEFVDEAEFTRAVESAEMMEWAEYAGRRYGTRRAGVEQRLESGQSVVLEIDVEGARQIKADHPDALLVFIAPPDFDELRRRLIGRGTESEVDVDRRMTRAREEMGFVGPPWQVVVNDEISVCSEQLLQLLSPQ
ncbi:MAG: guanylate kinase [Candidatus Nanopelagicales bacterium]|nr:guanylate kinase [Candidatus Nanopelagicales bacterium]MDZ4250826.1 guanylate kinase [Candidatus Nanopelagicales bacterium]